MLQQIAVLAQNQKQVKSFSYIRNGATINCKPKEGEAMVLFEDYLGSMSIIWIICFTPENFNEIYRFNAVHALRINF